MGGRRCANAVRVQYTLINAAIPAAQRPHGAESFRVVDTKWPSLPYNEGKRGTDEVSIRSFEHVKAQLFALEFMIPPFLMSKHWTDQGMNRSEGKRAGWIRSVHACDSGKELAQLLLALEVSFVENNAQLCTKTDDLSSQNDDSFVTVDLN